MGILIAIIMGGLAGWIASKIMGRDSQMGVPLNIVVGIAGAFIGNMIAGLFGAGGSITEFSLSGFVVALIGAIVLLGVINMATRKTVR